MNGSSDSVRALLSGLVSRSSAEVSGSGPEMAVFPPFVFLAQAAGLVAGTGIALGAQDCARETPGAFTGEVAAEMLADVGCRYVLVGHSERRALYGETDAVVAEKFERALDAGLAPVLCLGETLDEREAGATESVVARQVDAVLERLDAARLGEGVVAYEPVWAIGTGRTATPEQANDVHSFIRRRVAEQDAAVAAELRILYGGSVNPATAAGLFAQADIDGGLVGGASLKAPDFLAIHEAAG